ncbi:hypothetical protein C8J42_102499 [Sphingomonas sp. PP-CE-1A-559]|nr:hypothetical protein C8J42_102499 [Sphingomonas sp. PP-CE-1A-559]
MDNRVPKIDPKRPNLLKSIYTFNFFGFNDVTKTPYAVFMYV